RCDVLLCAHGGGRAATRLGEVAGLLEVEPGAEAAAGAGEDHDPARPVVTSSGESVVQIGDEFAAHSVQTLRPVEGQDGDALPNARVADGAHGSLPSAAVRARARSSGASRRSVHRSSSGAGPRQRQSSTLPTGASTRRVARSRNNIASLWASARVAASFGAPRTVMSHVPPSAGVSSRGP